MQLQYLLLHTLPTTTENINQAAATIIHAQWREKQGEAAGLAKSYDEQKKNWEELRAKHGKDGGPCLASLESTLQQHNIKRQAYHSGAFVGNHVHHALQPDVTTALTSAPLQVIQARTSGAEQQAEATARLVEEATTVKLRYQKLFSQYAICRRIFSSKNVLTPESEAECHAAIQTFLLTCREESHVGSWPMSPQSYIFLRDMLPTA